MSNDSVFVDQFICNVCHMVPNNSVLSRCCERMFCKQCIERIINRKSVCPVDNKPLTARDVMTVPKMVVNLRNKLRVKCDNYTICMHIDLMNSLHGFSVMTVLLFDVIHHIFTIEYD